MSSRPLPFMPTQRATFGEPTICYYPFGNTRPSDYLEHLAFLYKTEQELADAGLREGACANRTKQKEEEGETECRDEELRILVLGVGDMRSCFYTLWKLDVNRRCGVIKFCPKNEELQLNFVLNDSEPAIVARNIIFIYLAISMGQREHEHDKNEDYPKWKTSMLCAVWAIWYCNDLLPNHVEILKEALERILEATDDGLAGWENNILGSSGIMTRLCQIVSFKNEDALVKTAQHWKRWLCILNTGKPTIKQMQKERKYWLTTMIPNLSEARKILESAPTDDDSIEINLPFMFKAHTFFLFSDLEPCCEDSDVGAERTMKVSKEFSDYFFGSGNPLAEQCLSPRPSKKLLPASINPTFYAEDKYTIGPCNPFLNYDILPFCPADTCSSRRPPDDLWNKLDFAIDKSMVEEKPALASSFCQFSKWYSGCAAILSGVQCDKGVCLITGENIVQYSVKFQFDIRDGCYFLQELNDNLHDEANLLRKANGGVACQNYDTHDCKRKQFSRNCKKFHSIYTTNLLDYIPLVNLLGYSITLLDECGVFVTSSMAAPDRPNDLLFSYTGVCVELFPIIFGVQAIGYEGDYSDRYFSPQYLGKKMERLEEINQAPDNERRQSSEYIEFVFKHASFDCGLWQIESLETNLTLVNALFMFLMRNAREIDINDCRPGSNSYTANSFFIGLRLFLKRFHSSNDTNSDTRLRNNAKFWEPLVRIIKYCLPEYCLEEVQALAFAHDFHWHLTLNEDDCSFCDESLEPSICVFEADITNGWNTANQSYATNFYAFVIVSDDERYAKENRKCFINKLDNNLAFNSEINNRQLHGCQVFSVMDIVETEAVRGKNDEKYENSVFHRAKVALLQVIYWIIGLAVICYLTKFFSTSLSGNPYWFMTMRESINRKTKFKRKTSTVKVKIFIRRSLLILNESFVNIFAVRRLNALHEKCSGLKSLADSIELFSSIFETDSLSLLEIEKCYPVCKNFDYEPVDIIYVENSELDKFCIIQNTFQFLHDSDENGEIVDTGIPGFDLQPMGAVVVMGKFETNIFKTSDSSKTCYVKENFSLIQNSSNSLILKYPNYEPFPLVLPFTVDSKTATVHLLKTINGKQQFSLKIPRPASINIKCNLTMSMNFANLDNCQLFYKMPTEVDKPAILTIIQQFMLKTSCGVENNGPTAYIHVVKIIESLFDNGIRGCMEHFRFFLKEKNMSNKCIGLGTVLNAYIDIEKLTPALDFLFYWSQENEISDNDTLTIEKIVKASYLNKQPSLEDHESNYNNIYFDSWEDADLFLVCLKFFSFRTCISPEINSEFAEQMRQQNVDNKFHRALIYPMIMTEEEMELNKVYCNTPFHDSPKSLKRRKVDSEGDADTANKCANCNTSAIFQCSKCGAVWYCSKKCEKRDRKMHKEQCQNLNSVL